MYLLTLVEREGPENVHLRAFDVEGESRARNVVIEWPDSATAHKFYNSPDYSEALSYGIPAAIRDYIIVEGAE